MDVSPKESPEIAEGQGNQGKPGEGTEELKKKKESKAAPKITQGQKKEEYLFIYLGSWGTGGNS